MNEKAVYAGFNQDTHGITMLGRASGRHYLAFTGRERIVKASPQPTALA